MPCPGNVEGLSPYPGPHWKELEENLAGDEQLMFFDFITCMLKWLPDERPSAEEVLKHEWLKEKDGVGIILK